MYAYPPASMYWVPFSQSNVGDAGEAVDEIETLPVLWLVVGEIAFDLFVPPDPEAAASIATGLNCGDVVDPGTLLTRDPSDDSHVEWTCTLATSRLLWLLKELNDEERSIAMLDDGVKLPWLLDDAVLAALLFDETVYEADVLF